MVTALDLPQDLVEDIQLRAAREGRPIDETAAELLRAGLAAPSRATVVNADAAMLQKRKEIVEKFLSGEWATEFGRVRGRPRGGSTFCRGSRSNLERLA